MGSIGTAKKMKINMAIAKLRKSLVEAVNASELPPAVTAMILGEILHAVNDAARQQYESELREDKEEENG